MNRILAVPTVDAFQIVAVENVAITAESTETETLLELLCDDDSGIP